MQGLATNGLKLSSGQSWGPQSVPSTQGSWWPQSCADSHCPPPPLPPSPLPAGSLQNSDHSLLPVSHACWDRPGCLLRAPRPPGHSARRAGPPGCPALACYRRGCCGPEGRGLECGVCPSAATSVDLRGPSVSSCENRAVFTGCPGPPAPGFLQVREAWTRTP